MRERNFVACLLVAFISMAAAAAATAGVPQLVRNINQIPIGVGSEPRLLGALGGWSYFAANNGTNGVELWKTDGTASGTALVRDIEPGAGSSNPANFFVVGGVAYFTASNAASGTELWVTDGSTAGTRLFADLVPGPGASNAIFSGTLGATILIGTDTGSGPQLWRSDGTPAGTYWLSAMGMSPLATPNGIVTVDDDKAYFSGFVQPHGGEPWVTDGTVAGTHRLADVVVGEPTQFPNAFVRAGSYVYFRGALPPSHVELFRIRIADDVVERVMPGLQVLDVSSPFSPPLMALGDIVTFIGTTSGAQQLWRSDGTTGGSYALMSYDSMLGNSYIPPRFTVIGNRMVFASTQGTSVGFYRTDGTVAGTGSVFSPAMESGGVPTYLGHSDSYFYFAFSEGAIYRTDGTTAGTRLISVPADLATVIPTRWIKLAADGGRVYLGHRANTMSGISEYVILRYEESSDSSLILRRFSDQPGDNFGAAGGRLFFSRTDTANGHEPWTSDGTAEGTRLLANLAVEPTESGSNPSAFFTHEGRLYFSATDGVAGQELWRTDGTANGTELVADVMPGQFGSEPSKLFAAGGSLMFFAADTGTSPRPLLKYDSRSNLVERHPLALDGSRCPAQSSAAIGGTTLFAAYGPSGAVELWRSDGAIDGTMEVMDIVAGFGSSDPCEFVALDDKVFFIAQSLGTAGKGLWVSDGTTAGTRRLAAVSNVSPTELVAYRNAIYFFSPDSNGVLSLWRTDGSAADATLVASAPPEFANGTATPLGVVNDVLLLSATTVSGTSLWTFDATTALYAPLSAYWGSGIVLENQRLAIFAGVSNGRLAPWVTDGTPAGTRSLLDNPDASMNTLQWLGEFHNVVLFTVRDSDNSSQLWRTDGTPERTVAVTTFANGQAPVLSSQPAVGVAGDRFFFALSDATIGTELYALENDPPVAGNDNASVAAGQSVVIDVLSNDADADGALDPATVSIVTAPRHGTATVSSDGKVTYAAASGFSGNDTFSYSVRDRQGRAARAPSTVTIAVTGTSNPPAPPGGGGGGGGGGIDLISLLLALSCAIARSILCGARAASEGTCCRWRRTLRSR